MVRLILGVKGSGKTKQLIEMINNAAKDEPGSVVSAAPIRPPVQDSAVAQTRPRLSSASASSRVSAAVAGDGTGGMKTPFFAMFRVADFIDGVTPRRPTRALCGPRRLG